MPSSKSKALTVLLTIGSFLLLCILFCIFVFIAAVLFILIISLFSKSLVVNGIWTFLSAVRSDGAIGLLYLLVYGLIYALPFILASKIISLILRKQDTAAKWTFLAFGYVLLALCIPTAIYYLFADGSSIPYIDLCFIGGCSISMGNDV